MFYNLARGIHASFYKLNTSSFLYAGPDYMIIDIECFLPIKSPHEPLITRVVNASIMDMHIRLGGLVRDTDT